MKRIQKIHTQRQRRARRTRASTRSDSRPRLSVFRSNRYIAAQIIDDGAGRTIATASDRELKGKQKKMVRARSVGVELAKRAIAAEIRKVRFDRGRYQYHGLVAALAEGARAGGLEF